MISNPLSIALGSVFKEQRERYAHENNISENEVISLIANRCALAEITIKSMDLGNYVPSIGVATRLSKSGFYQMDYSKLMLILSIVTAMGKSFVSLEKYVEKCDSVVNLISDEMLLEIMEDLKKMEWENSYKNGYIKDQIFRNGVFEKMEKYLSQDDHLPKRRTKLYADHASFDEMEFIAETEKDLFPEKHADLDYHKRYWEKNNEFITIIYKDSSKSEKLGYFKLYPLSKERVGQYLSGDLKESTPDNITSSFKDAHGLLVSVATLENMNFYKSGLIVKEMIEHVKSLMHYQNINMLFTYPRSKEGQHLMDKFGFKIGKGGQKMKIKSGDPISVLVLTEDTLDRFNIDHILTYS